MKDKEPNHLVVPDYRVPRRTTSRKQLWIGISLWILIALLLTALAISSWLDRHDPKAWE